MCFLFCLRNYQSFSIGKSIGTVNVAGKQQGTLLNRLFVNVAVVFGLRCVEDAH